MVKCPKCGEVLTENDKTCPVCGYQLSSVKESKFNNKILAVIAIIVVIAIVGVLASGMFSTDNSSGDVSVNDNSDSVKNVKEDSSNSNSTSASSEYWASAKTDKFHLPTCEWAEKISEDNKIIYTSREDAIADGKEPCGVCNP